MSSWEAQHSAELEGCYIKQFAYEEEKHFLDILNLWATRSSDQGAN